jgi:UrcA family protein
MQHFDALTLTNRDAMKIPIAFVLLSVIPAFGLAAQGDEAPTYLVHFGDLNLQSAGGSESLYSRIRKGAEIVCGTFDAKEVAKAALHKRCMEEAIADAVTQVNQPHLTACYLAHNHGRAPLVVSSTLGSRASTALQVSR